MGKTGSDDSNGEVVGSCKVEEVDSGTVVADGSGKAEADNSGRAAAGDTDKAGADGTIAEADNIFKVEAVGSVTWCPL